MWNLLFDSWYKISNSLHFPLGWRMRNNYCCRDIIVYRVLYTTFIPKKLYLFCLVCQNGTSLTLYVYGHIYNISTGRQSLPFINILRYYAVWDNSFDCKEKWWDLDKFYSEKVSRNNCVGMSGLVSLQCERRRFPFPHQHVSLELFLGRDRPTAHAKENIITTAPRRMPASIAPELLRNTNTHLNATNALSVTPW